MTQPVISKQCLSRGKYTISSELELWIQKARATERTNAKATCAYPIERKSEKRCAVTADRVKAHSILYINSDDSKKSNFECNVNCKYYNSKTFTEISICSTTTANKKREQNEPLERTLTSCTPCECFCLLFCLPVQSLILIPVFDIMPASIFLLRFHLLFNSQSEDAEMTRTQNVCMSRKRRAENRHMTYLMVGVFRIVKYIHHVYTVK